MQVMVLGGGVIGVTTAWYLAKAGHQVTVIEQHAGVAQETSFANAGQISPGYATPWAAPGIPLKVLKWLLQRDAPFRFQLDGHFYQLEWLWQTLQNCNAASYAINKERMVRLAEYSRDCLKALRQETAIRYDERQLGTLQLFRTEQQLQQADKDIQVLAAAGVPYRLLTASQLTELDPALQFAQSPLAGGLYLPTDETGDCQLFTERLMALAQQQGVTFLFNQTIDKLLINQQQVTGVRCADNVWQADRYVMACGVYSRYLLPTSWRLPVYPVKGYSLTMPLRDQQAAPFSTLLDESYKIAITRFDQRLRVGGMAEVVGFNKQLVANRCQLLLKVAQDLYPQAGDSQHVQYWTGLRPMTPDSTPIIGKTPLTNLYLNTGHGTLGWTMACGSGQLLADIIDGQPTAIGCEDLALARYHR